VNDSDSDGLADQWEILHFGDLPHGPTDDEEPDGLNNFEEYVRLTDPNDADSDDDGLSDGDEVYVHGTDPADPDSDDDDLSDGDEIIHGTLLLDPDSDDDGMTDGWEVEHSLDPLTDDADDDPDLDTLTNIEEFGHDTNPRDPDTDSDGFDDAEEIAAGSDPLSPFSFPVGWLALAGDPSYFPYVDVQTPPSPDYWPRANISFAAADGKLYSVGGYGPRTHTDTTGFEYPANRQSGFSIFDIAGGTWMSARWDGTGPTGYNNSNGTAGPTRDQGTYTGNNQCFAYDHDSDGTKELFVLGGYPIWDGWFSIYDPDTDAWSHTAGRSGGVVAAYHATALEANGVAYVYGGIFNGPDGDGLYTYDIGSDAWTQHANGPVRMKQHCGEIVGNTMYLISGQQDSLDYSTAVVMYDLTTGAWDTETGEPIPTGVHRAASCVHDGKIHVVGGVVDSGQSFGLIQVYDPMANTWSSSLPLPAPRSRHGAEIVGNTLYVASGYGPAAGGVEENKSDLWAVDLTTVDLPRARADTPPDDVGGFIALDYRLFDVSANECSVFVEYSIDGGSSWNPATMGPGSDGDTDLSSSPTGTPHLFVWNAIADLGQAGSTTVRLRVTPSDPEAGAADETVDFVILTGRLGDLNCDDVLDGGDVGPFVQAIIDVAAYETVFPSCAVSLADVNADGQADAGDVAEFVQLLLLGT